MGYLSAARMPSPARVAELAAGTAYGVLLPEAGAAELIQAGVAARRAARSWMTGGPLSATQAPKLRIPAPPSLSDASDYAAQILATSPEATARGRRPRKVPVTFAAKRTVTFQDAVNQLQEYLASDACRGASPEPADCAEAGRALNAWLTGDVSHILPDWVVEIIFG